MANGKRVVFSYDKKSEPFARELGKAMSRGGVSVFALQDETRPGDSWADVLRKGLEDSSALVFLIPSGDMSNRNTVWFEVGAARASGKRVLAVLPPGRRFADLPVEMADVLVLDADKRDVQSIAAMLAEAVPDATDAVAAG